MLSDPGYIALILVFTFWVSLILLAVLVGLFPRKWRQRGTRTLGYRKSSSSNV